jgi:hypothetical protein
MSVKILFQASLNIISLVLFLSGKLSSLFWFESTVPQLLQERFHPLCELCGEASVKASSAGRARCFLRRRRWYRCFRSFRWFSRSSGLRSRETRIAENVYSPEISTMSVDDGPEPVPSKSSTSSSTAVFVLDEDAISGESVQDGGRPLGMMAVRRTRPVPTLLLHSHDGREPHQASSPIASSLPRVPPRRSPHTSSQGGRSSYADEATI